MLAKGWWHCTCIPVFSQSTNNIINHDIKKDQPLDLGYEQSFPPQFCYHHILLISVHI